MLQMSKAEQTVGQNQILVNQKPSNLKINSPSRTPEVEVGQHLRVREDGCDSTFCAELTSGLVA